MKKKTDLEFRKGCKSEVLEWTLHSLTSEIHQGYITTKMYS